MHSQKAMRMFFALTTSRDWEVAGFDISQAYTIAECPFNSSLMELHPVPTDSENTDFRFGHGKGSVYIAKMKRMLYSHPSSSRFWMNRLVKFMSKIGALRCITDRMIVTWESQGEKVMMFLIHVDDIVKSYSAGPIKEQFAQLIREEFGTDRVAGGEE